MWPSIMLAIIVSDAGLAHCDKIPNFLLESGAFLERCRIAWSICSKFSELQAYIGHIPLI